MRLPALHMLRLPRVQLQEEACKAIDIDYLHG